ncbi:DNA cytosine methyltransferase [Patescibacteria group bacterium]|nr:DNA cytosine methyltransferase [Patescibacteria group bacterium]
MKNKKFTYIDIFAGCGGLSLGLYNSKKWRGIFAVEKNKDAFMTLKHNLIDSKNHFNFPEWLDEKEHDINEILKNKNLRKYAGKIDLVVGGPPCQGFSLAGRRNEKDARNSLVYSYLKFIKVIQPKILFFENVKGFGVSFKGTNKKPMSETVIEELQKIGYKDARFEILDFSQFGIPQSRKRIVIIATKNGKAQDFFSILKKQSQKILKKKGLNSYITLGEAISDLYKGNSCIKSPDSVGFTTVEYKPIKSKYQKLMRQNIDHNIPDSHRFANHTTKTLKKFSQIINEKLSSKKIQQKFCTKKTSTRLLDQNKPSPTITTLPDDYVHYKESRILTVREYARIQSFPDDFEFKGKYTTGGKLRKKEVPRYTQIGNAIPPLFGEQVGVILAQLLK